MKPTNMKATILAASTKLMAKQGIKNTSLSDIAKEVGISKGTLYDHYASKDDIICDMADMHLSIITNSLIECLQNVDFDSSTEEFVSVTLNKISDIKNGISETDEYLDADYYNEYNEKRRNDEVP